MKKITNAILWYIVSGLWAVNLVIKLISEEKNYALIALTAANVILSLTVGIINHRNHLKEKNTPQDTDTDTEN